MQRRARLAQPQPDHPPASTSALKRPVLGEPEMGELKTTEGESQDIVMTSLHWDHGLEIYGHLEAHEISDFDLTFTSTIGYNTDELVEIFHGL